MAEFDAIHEGYGTRQELSVSASQRVAGPYSCSDIRGFSTATLNLGG